MNLVINNELEEDITDFCNWLIKDIQSSFKGFIDANQLIRFDDIINNSIEFKQLPRYINPIEIIIGSMYNLRLAVNNSVYTIEIDPNINIPDTYTKFIDIARLVNFGNLTVNPYPIFTEIFQFYADNLNDYFLIYLSEGD